MRSSVVFNGKTLNGAGESFRLDDDAVTDGATSSQAVRESFYAANGIDDSGTKLTDDFANAIRDALQAHVGAADNDDMSETINAFYDAADGTDQVLNLNVDGVEVTPLMIVVV